MTNDNHHAEDYGALAETILDEMDSGGNLAMYVGKFLNKDGDEDKLRSDMKKAFLRHCDVVANARAHLAYCEMQRQKTQALWLLH